MRYFFTLLLTFAYSTVYANENEASAKKLASSSLNSTEGLLQWMFSTILVIVIIFVLAYLMKKMRFIPKMSSDLSIVAQLALGPKEKIVKVKVQDKYILLGVTSNNISYLCDIENTNKSFDNLMKDEIEKDKILIDSKQDGTTKA